MLTRRFRSDRTHLSIGLVLAGCIAACSSSGTSGATSGGDGGATTGEGGGAGAAGLVNCMTADTRACGSFTTPTEDGGTATIELGSYGAQADPNVGTGFENTTTASMQPGGTFCAGFAGIFNENPSLTAMLLQTMANGISTNFALYTVYRPAKWPSTPVPVITWGNGTCAQPEGYGALLRYVASYGYFIVAANTTQVGTKNSDGSQPMLKALDYAAAANKDPASPYYQKLDMSKVGAMGHSQGGGATVTAASDSRIQDIIIFNAADTAPKPYLAISGDADITMFTAQGMMTAIDGASVPAAYLFYHDPIGSAGDKLKGHLVLMLTPSRVTTQTVAWWQMAFRNDPASTADFVGASCGFCGHTSDPTNAYDYGQQGLPPGSGAGQAVDASAE